MGKSIRSTVHDQINRLRSRPEELFEAEIARPRSQSA